MPVVGDPVAGPAPDLGNYTHAGCDNFTGDTWQPLRPAFHITVPYGWMNDPHGMFQLKDSVHLFFQYNPKALAWGESLIAWHCQRTVTSWYLQNHAGTGTAYAVRTPACSARLCAQLTTAP